MVDANIALHERDAAEEDVELAEIHLPLETFIRLRDEDIGNVFLGKAHPEQVKLSHVGDSVPMLAPELSFGMGKAVTPSATSPWRCPCPWCVELRCIVALHCSGLGWRSPAMACCCCCP